MYTCVYPCISVYNGGCILVYTHVYCCISMYTFVYQHILGAYPCIPVYTGILLHMYTGVYALCVYLYTGIHVRYQGNMVLNHVKIYLSQNEFPAPFPWYVMTIF